MVGVVPIMLGVVLSVGAAGYMVSHTCFRYRPPTIDFDDPVCTRDGTDPGTPPALGKAFITVQGGGGIREGNPLECEHTGQPATPAGV